jgi:2-polyprenyl-3-methyl-5-hydroxy-6-metoxy-1,4-benzoquinol methylase
MEPRFVDAGPCWICASSELMPVHANTFELSAYKEQDPELAAYSGASVELRRCAACGFAQPDRLPALAGYFERMYDQRWSAEWVAAEFDSAAKAAIFDGILRSLERRLPSTGRSLLDVGAHVGKFVAAARARGWRAEGLELNPTTAAFAGQRTGGGVHRSSLQTFIRTSRGFDAVSAIDVLEHIPHPAETLRDIFAALAPGGWIAVKVPCGPTQILKERLRVLAGRAERVSVADNLVHVSHFSPRSLELALERAGFTGISLEVGMPERRVERSWRATAANAVREGVFLTARITGGARSPLAFNLQAYARKAPRS